MEVFVAFSKEEQIPILEQTMEAWAACDMVEPVGIRAPQGKYEMVRRITADNMADGQYYILADLGCVPGEGFDVCGVLKRLSATDAETGSRELGLVGFGKEGRELGVPTGVRVCRKGAVGRWVPKSTDSYDQEHANAIKLAGRDVTIWTDVRYKHLLEC